MEFARQNKDIKCVFYAKAGTIRDKANGTFNTTPRILAEGSCGYLEAVQILHGYSRKTTNIVTKSFYDEVIFPSWLLNNRDTDFNKITKEVK